MKKKILAAFLLACALALSVAQTAWAATVNYAVTGGNIQFDTETGTITGADESITVAKIPFTIEGVAVKKIGSAAFLNCNNLTSITIPDSVTDIGNQVFRNCSSLTSITIPDGVTSVGQFAFEGCKSLTSITIPDSVTSIEYNAFRDCSGLASITIPDSVINIESAAFSGCSGLTSIIVPDGVVSIGDFAFSNCSSLTSITIPDSVTSIGVGVFAENGNMININVDLNNSAYISENNILFNKDKSILVYYPVGKTEEFYAIPESVTSIEGYAFGDCSNLANIIIPDSVTSIGDFAFSGCSRLTNIIIPDGVSIIENGVFYNCSSLTSVTIPDSVTSIGYSAFSGCDSLTSITIPDGVTSIGDFAFDYCKSLTNINIPASVTSIKLGTFTGCSNLTSITIPDGITSIGYYAFQYCSSLTNVTILDGVTNIETRAFSNCSSLTSITIPDSVTSIGNYAFFDCSSLTDVYYAGSEAEWLNIEIGSFNEPLTNATIHYNSTALEEPANVQVTGVTLNETALNLQVNGTAILQATVAPENATNKSVRWSSNNTSVATVDANGKITAVAAGTATITVTTEDGNKTATCMVTVVEKQIPVTSITLDKTTLSLEVKTTAQLKATVEPTDTTSTISWTSSDEKVATVDSTGKVTPLAKGTATITAAADGVKATCEVTVTADTVYTITFDTDGGTLAEGVTNPDYVTKGKEYKMPTASKSGYTLTAWAIGAQDSENKVKANEVYTFTADTTVYAIWQYNGGGSSGGSSSRPGTSGGTTTTTPGTTTTGTTTPSTSSGSNTVTAANINNVFADVQNNAWYSEAIAYVYNNGIMNGTENGFEPNATTTRAMLVTMLFRLEGEPAAGNPAFSDVASGQWFSDAIAWASANGVVNGYENGLFGPNDSITREQLAVILYRFAQLKGYAVSANGSLSSFSDSGSVSDWAQEAMQWAVGAGIINGDNGALKPAGNATRAEVATMLMRFSENIAK